MDKVNLFFVSHSHWDREWYRSFEVFRKTFVEIMKDFMNFLEKNPDTPTFTLDGQTSLIEDYLEIYPEDYSKLKDFIFIGKIKIGPWFTALEPSLIEGESIVRNLLTGDELCHKYGNKLNSGYLPDAAGLISQIPQIMKLAGINHIIFTRGMGNEEIHTEYTVIGSDKTAITATYLVQAYNNACYLPSGTKELKERISSEVKRIADFASTSWILMNQGGDHNPPQKNLFKLLNVLKSSGDYMNIESGSFDNYYNKIKVLLSDHLPVLHTELKGSKYFPVSNGIFSARIDVKLRNYYLENRITKFIEPFSVMCLMEKNIYPSAALKRIWKLLLLNHHHDTIGGTVSDTVYRESMIRYQKIEDLTDVIWKEGLNIYTGSFEKEEEGGIKPVIILNTGMVHRTDMVKIKWTTQKDIEKYISITDDEGNIIPCQIIQRKTLERHYPFFGSTPVGEFDIIFEATDVPAMGYKVYSLTQTEEDTSEAQEEFISNEFFQVGFEEEGTFYIKELYSGTLWSGLNAFIDESDCGDLYTFSSIVNEKGLTKFIKNLTYTTMSGKIQKTLKITGTMAIPEGLNDTGTKRKDKLLLCPFAITVNLYKGIPLVDCSLEIENLAYDHRLRVVFPYPFRENHVRAGQPFDILERRAVNIEGFDWIEKPSLTKSFQEFLDIQGTGKGFSIFTGGIQEYEILHEDNKSEIALTLLRSTGWLSRENNMNRRIEVAPKIPVSQCKGRFVYHYGLVPHEGKEEGLKKVISLWQRYRNPLRGEVVPSINYLPLCSFNMRLSPSYLVISACKKARDRETVIIRFYNPLDCYVEGKLETGEQFEWYRRVNLLEESQEDLKALPAEIQVKPKEIISLELVFKRRFTTSRLRLPGT